MLLILSTWLRAFDCQARWDWRLATMVLAIVFPNVTLHTHSILAYTEPAAPSHSSTVVVDQNTQQQPYIHGIFKFLFQKRLQT